MRSGLRALDSLHMATIIDLGTIVTGLLCFDDELTRRAAEHGINAA